MTKPRCANCGHAADKHTTKPVQPCAVKCRTGWTGIGRNRRPVIGYCTCDRYEPEDT